MSMRQWRDQLRLDLGADVDLSDQVLERCIRKAVFPLNTDLKTSMTLGHGTIKPKPSGATLNLLLQLARIHACQVMRAQTATGFNFSSGDQRVDKSKQSEHWAKLEKDLRAQYQQDIQALQPSSTTTQADHMLTPRLSPLIFEQGSHAWEGDHA